MFGLDGSPPLMVDADGNEVIVRIQPGEVVPGKVVGIKVGLLGNHRLVFEVDPLWHATTVEAMRAREADHDQP